MQPSIRFLPTIVIQTNYSDFHTDPTFVFPEESIEPIVDVTLHNYGLEKVDKSNFHKAVLLKRKEIEQFLSGKHILWHAVDVLALAIMLNLSQSSIKTEDEINSWYEKRFKIGPYPVERLKNVVENYLPNQYDNTSVFRLKAIELVNKDNSIVKTYIVDSSVGASIHNGKGHDASE